MLREYGLRQAFRNSKVTTVKLKLKSARETERNQSPSIKQKPTRDTEETGKNRL